MKTQIYAAPAVKGLIHSFIEITYIFSILHVRCTSGRKCIRLIYIWCNAVNLEIVLLKTIDVRRKSLIRYHTRPRAKDLIMGHLVLKSDASEDCVTSRQSNTALKWKYQIAR